MTRHTTIEIEFDHDEYDTWVEYLFNFIADVMHDLDWIKDVTVGCGTKDI